MQLNFSLRRLIPLAVLLAAFWLLDGFTRPIVDNGFNDPRRVTKAWIYCIILFVSGAGCVSIVDHYVGLIDRSNLRFLYVIAGILMMVAGVIWSRMLHDL